MKNGIREQGAVHCRLSMTDVVDAMFKKRMQIKWLTKSVASLLVMAVLLGCDRHEKYQVVDSGIQALDDWPVYWIDNNTVIFVGTEAKGTIKEMNQAQSWNLGIYVWEIGKGVHRHADSKQTMCYDRGFISYDVRKKDATGTGASREVHVEGMFPNEVEVVHPTQNREEPRRNYFNDFTCKYVHRDLMTPGRKVYPLRDEHGTFFVEDPRVEPDAVPKLIKPDGQKIDLPMLRGIFGGPDAFYDFNGGYLVFFGLNMRLPVFQNEQAVQGAWLFPDGRVEKFHISSHPAFLRASVVVFASKKGFLYASFNEKSATEAGYAGLYLDDATGLKKVVDGIVNRAAVSPDGCRIAFGNAATLRDRQQGRSKMKMIDFCKH